MVIRNLCDICAGSLAGYFPGCCRCDKCTDAHGLEFESLPDSLADIASGIDPSPWE